MSRIGKMPVVIPDKVNVKVTGQVVEAQGPLGKLILKVHEKISVTMKDKSIILGRNSDDELDRSLHGLERSRVFNIIQGVFEGFKKELTLIGVGYRAQVSGSIVNFQLGYSHPIVFDVPKGITVKIEKQTSITLVGPDKEELGLTAARMRALRPPEPYKGKGVRYNDEHVLRKAGKAAAAGGKK